jgi:hypothetical protein
MAENDNPRPLPTGAIVRAGLAAVLLVFLVFRASRMRAPVFAIVALALALVLVLADQIRRIIAARRPPVEERVSKHPLGLDD